jgi:hypothetical protein
MAQIHLLVPSFNAGELSPLLSARFAVEKVQSGCRKLRNFILHTHGPAFRRPGMEYMGATASQTTKSSLRGFNFSTTTGFVLEFNESGMQVWSNGLLVPLINPVILPYSEAECAEVQMAQVNDICYLAHPNHHPLRLVRHADDDWRLEQIEWVFPPLGDENVRNDEIASSVATTQISVPTHTWPEFTASGDFTLDAFTVDTSAAIKFATLQYLDGSNWVTWKTISWTTVAPVAATGTHNPVRTYRITYSGPLSPASGTVEVQWTGGGAGSFNIPTDEIQPQDTAESYIVPAKTEWQTTVVCGAVIRPDSELWLQKKVGSDWVDVKKLRIEENETFIRRGSTETTAIEYRFDWRGRAMAGGTASLQTLAFPVTDDITLTLSATTGTGVTLTASKPIFQAGHVGSYWQITHRRDTAYAEIVSDVPTITGASSAALRVLGDWDVTSYGSWASTLHLEKNFGGAWGSIRSWKSNKDRNVIAHGTEEKEATFRLRIEAGTSAAASGAAVPRFILELADARINGLVKITAVGSLTDGKTTTATVDVIIDAHSTAPTPIWTEGAWSDVRGFPRTVALHGQRLWFGGTNTEPLRLWGSLINDYQNFTRTTRDDSSVSFTPAAAQSNRLQWMASHGDDLVLGTTGEEWTVSGGVDDGPITPVSVKIQRRSRYGSNYLPAVLLGDVVIFSQRGGQKLRQVSPRSDNVVWSASDLTVLAEHVTKTGIMQFASMDFPASILWAVTSDGKLLGMTFEQEQNVFGWHVHTTDGLVESVAVVFGADADEVWLAVNRNGQRNIERLDTAVLAREFSAPERLIYLDSATRFEFEEPTNELSGLEHLEGRTVDVLGDGAHLQSVRVIDGAAIIEDECSTIIVGLPFVSELQPMRVEIPLRDGTAQGRVWRITRVAVELHDSLGGEVADDPAGKFEQFDVRQISDPMDTAPALITDVVETALESEHRDGFDVAIRQTAPLPLNVGSIVLKGDVYGE